MILVFSTCSRSLVVITGRAEVVMSTIHVSAKQHPVLMNLLKSWPTLTAGHEGARHLPPHPGKIGSRP